MRIIYEERRDGGAFFLVAGLLVVLLIVVGLIWGGMLAVSAITWSEVAEVWDKAWKTVVGVGAILLILGLVDWAGNTRITVDERGIKKLRGWDGDCFLIEWATVGSWRVESYEKASYEMGTRLVVEFASAEKPTVLEDPRYLTAVVAELSAVVPEKYSRDVSAADQACMTTPDTLNLTAVVAEPSAVVPERYSRDVSATDKACITPPETLTHSGFSWVESAEGYRLDFPPFPDRQPLDAITLRMCLGTLAAAIVLGILVATGDPFGDRFTRIIGVLLTVGGLYSVSCLHERSSRRSAFNRSFAYLDIGPDFVTVESRDGRKQKWGRAGIHFVKLNHYVDENSESFVVMLCFHDGSSLSLKEPLDRAGGEWLTTTLRQVLGLTSPVKFEFSGLQEQLKGAIHRKKP